jgi:uncharacterized protein (TIGR02246 family)
MRRRLLVPMVLLGLSAACSTPAPAPAPAVVDLAADEQAVRDISMQWLKLQNAKDMAGIAALFADDGTLFRENHDPVTGRAAIEAFLIKDKAENPSSTVGWTTDRVEVAPSGDLAVEHGTWADKNLGLKGTDEDNGKYVTVYRKVNGAWKVTTDISLSTKPEQAATPAS